MIDAIAYVQPCKARLNHNNGIIAFNLIIEIGEAG